MPDDNQKIKWKIEEIDELVRIRQTDEFVTAFNNAKTTQAVKKVWEELAERIDKEGFGKEVNDKYVSLLKTYRNKKLARKTSGEAPVVWKYFEIFDEYCGESAKIFPENTTDTLEEAVFNEGDESENSKKRIKKNNTTKINFQEFVMNNMQENLEIKKKIVESITHSEINENNIKIEKIDKDIKELKDMFIEFMKKSK